MGRLVLQNFPLGPGNHLLFYSEVLAVQPLSKLFTPHCPEHTIPTPPLGLVGLTLADQQSWPYLGPPNSTGLVYLLPGPGPGPLHSLHVLPGWLFT